MTIRMKAISNRLLDLKTLILFLFIFSVNAQENNDNSDLAPEKDVTIKVKESKTKLYIIGDYITVGSPSGGAALSGIGVSFQGQFALNKNYAVNISARQNFSFAGTSIITSFDGRLTYALTGKLLGEDKETFINGVKVADAKDYDLSGFRLQLVASQYYFNASATTVPYNGLGISAYYEMTNKNRFNYIMGARFDSISNSSFTAAPLSVFFGVGIPF